MSIIRELFKTSPFEPLLHQLQKVNECVQLVRPMLEAVQQGQYDKLNELTEQVFKREHEADIIKDEIRQVIPRSFFLPVYRGDLLGYLKQQDDMADTVEDLAILLTLKQLQMPEKLAEQIFSYVDTVIDVCDKNFALNESLRNLVAKGFHADEAEGVIEQIKVVEKAEWQSDKSQYSLTQSLFTLEDEIKPATLMLWWRVFIELGQLANHAEKAADRLRRMLSQ